MWKLNIRYVGSEHTFYSESQTELELLKFTLQNNKLVQYASSVTFCQDVRKVN